MRQGQGQSPAAALSCSLISEEVEEGWSLTFYHLQDKVQTPQQAGQGSQPYLPLFSINPPPQIIHFLFFYCASYFNFYISALVKACHSKPSSNSPFTPNWEPSPLPLCSLNTFLTLSCATIAFLALYNVCVYVYIYFTFFQNLEWGEMRSKYSVNGCWTEGQRAELVIFPKWKWTAKSGREWRQWMVLFSGTAGVISWELRGPTQGSAASVIQTTPWAFHSPCK